MKELRLFLAILTILVLGFIKSAKAQNVVIRTYIEQTSVTPKSGLSYGYQSKFGFEVGGFFQSDKYMESLSVQERSNMPTVYEREFYGMFVAAPVFTRDIFEAKVNVRTGMVNNEYFAITPSVTTELRPLDRLRIGAGIGVRSFNPTWQASVGITL